MALGGADVFQIVVFALDTHTFLGGGGAGIRPFLLPQKHIGKLVHPGVGEQQGGVIVLRQRRTGHNFVADLVKKVEEGLADFIAGSGFFQISLFSLLSWLKKLPLNFTASHACPTKKPPDWWPGGRLLQMFLKTRKDV